MRDPSTVERALSNLPDVEAMRRQILVGDLGLLRDRYPDSVGLRDAMSGVWLPDALAGAAAPAWRRTYGFGLRDVDQFVAGGFHPEELAVLTGRFAPGVVAARLREHGYRRRGGLLAWGAGGTIDVRTSAGRLALSSLSRVDVTRVRLAGASTSDLALQALPPRPSLALDGDLALAGRTLGEVTSGVVLPRELVRPPSSVPIAPLVGGRARLVAVGLDDRGPDGRIVRIALVYGSEAEAEADANVLGNGLARAELPLRPGTAFGELLEDLAVSVEGGRAVLVAGRIPAGESPGLWRGLLESGDLAVLVRQF